MNQDEIESLYRAIYSDARIDRSEATEIVDYFESIGSSVPKSKLVWIRASAFRIASEYLNDDIGHNTSIFRCINYVVHGFEQTLLDIREDECENEFDKDQAEDLFRQIYSDNVVDDEENTSLFEFFKQFIGCLDFDEIVSLRASAFRIASEFLSDNNMNLLRSINVIVHALELTLMEPKSFQPEEVESIGTDVSLNDAVQHLWYLDSNNRCRPNDDYILNVQEGKKPYQNYDGADEPLFTMIDQSVLRRKTYRLFTALLDNYVAETGNREQFTSNEKREVRNFLDAIMTTAPMRYCHEYCIAHGDGIPDDVEEFKTMLNHIWFKLYTREYGDGADSSGFEHVFVGEIKNGQVSGFHNWIRFYLEEKEGNVNYKGYIKPRSRSDAVTDDNDHVLTLQFEWNGVEKSVGTSLIGVSPEFEMALYTMCFLTGDKDNEVELETGTGDVFGLNVKCYKYAGDKIGTCYVEATEHYEE